MEGSLLAARTQKQTSRHHVPQNARAALPRDGQPNWATCTVVCLIDMSLIRTG